MLYPVSTPDRCSAPNHMQGRSELEGVTEFLGRPPQLVAVLQPAPAAAFAISGYAALPPYGQPGTDRQCIYVNGRWVKAAPLARWVLGQTLL